MNKTVNINLAGTFFHIDEDAYNKLTRYLTAIKKSFRDPKGQEEIIRDIEARIAELFSEKIDPKRQVISMKELDEVIAVMGQPEDYAVDEDIFEEATNTESTASKKGYKKLYRDPDNKYLGGVSAGLAHYIGIDAIWVRLAWILLTIFSSGTFILIYIIFWILVPEAKTVPEKLTMKGEEVNISNIEKKIKENYDNVAEKIKNADYDKYGQKIKSGSESFVDAMGKVIMALLTVFVKFIGVLIILIASCTLIALFVGFFTALFGFSQWQTEFLYMIDPTVVPLWVILLMALFAVGIPFFFLFILGLKILINNLKSMGRPAKLTLLGVWLLSVIGLSAFAISQASQQAYDANTVNTEVLDITPRDTLYLSMRANTTFERTVNRSGGLSLKYNEAGEEVLYSNNIRLIVRSTRDTIASISVEKEANGSSYPEAKSRAEAIRYDYALQGDSLYLDGYFLTDLENRYRDQQVEVILYLPVGSVLMADTNTYSFHRNSSSYQDILDNGEEGHYLEIAEDETICLDCPEKKIIWKSVDGEINLDENWEATWEEGNKVKIDRDGVNINVTDKKDSVLVKIDRSGVEVKSN